MKNDANQVKVCSLLGLQGEDGMDLEISLDSISEEERQKFLQAVAGGHLNKFITIWEPWWQGSEIHGLSVSDTGTPVVQDCETPPTFSHIFKEQPKK